MTFSLSNPIVIALLSAAVSAVFTLVTRVGARRFGFVATPKADRWHKKPTAMLGGIPIFLTTAAAYFLLVPINQDSLAILGGATIVFAVGLVDDIFNIKPYQKLIGQLIASAAVIAVGLRLNWTGFEVVDLWLTVFWIVGITNAINLLDNMDGLAAGIASIAAASLAVSFGIGGQWPELLFISALIGALVGFLIFNFNPASIFMGDCGSMFIGFLLASSVLLHQAAGRSRGIISILAVPALILFVPIFDTTFVTIMRKMSGRKASQGGRDHTSHRLVALGLSERKAVLMLYAFAFAAGAIALFLNELETAQSLALIAAFSIALIIAGVYLAGVKVYEDPGSGSVKDTAVFGFILNVSYKRRIFEVLLDGILISLAYYLSYLFLFGPFEENGNWSLFLKSLPLLIVVKLLAFLWVGVYRGMWRYTGVRDLFTFAKGSVFGSAISVLAILLLYRFNEFSRAVFTADAVIMFLFLALSRFAFRFFRYLLPIQNAEGGVRVILYGAGDGGELALRELANNSNWNAIPIGFIDDDPHKAGKMIHGLPVLGVLEDVERVCREQNVSEILISFRDSSPERFLELKKKCRDANIALKRAMFVIESVELSGS